MLISLVAGVISVDGWNVDDKLISFCDHNLLGSESLSIEPSSTISLAISVFRELQ
jgi:hypothetical protein